MNRLIMIIFIIGLCFFTSNVQASYNLGKYFPLNQEDNWVYAVKERSDKGQESTSSREVSILGNEAMDGKETIKILTKYNEEEYDYSFIVKDSEGIKEYKVVEDDGDYTIFESPALLFPAQIDTGDSVEYSGTFTDFDSNGKLKDKAKIKKTISLAGIEEVTVAAGLFKDVLKFFINEVINYENGNFEINSYTTWLAPDVGMVKELNSFSGISANMSGESKEEKEVELKNAVVGKKNIGQ